MNRAFGLPEEVLSQLAVVLREYPEIEAAGIFGSRAMGNHKPGSDIDMVLYGPEVSQETIFSLGIRFDTLPLFPWHVDLAGYSIISDEDLKSHIDTHAEVFYRRQA